MRFITSAIDGERVTLRTYSDGSKVVRVYVNDRITYWSKSLTGDWQKRGNMIASKEPSSVDISTVVWP